MFGQIYKKQSSPKPICGSPYKCYATFIKSKLTLYFCKDEQVTWWGEKLLNLILLHLVIVVWEHPQYEQRWSTYLFNVWKCTHITTSFDIKRTWWLVWRGSAESWWTWSDGRYTEPWCSSCTWRRKSTLKQPLRQIISLNCHSHVTWYSLPANM